MEKIITTCEEIIVRCFNKELRSLQHEISKAIIDHTDLRIKLLDHSEITLEDFSDDFKTGVRIPISLDSFLSKKFNIPHLRISRVFNETGDVVERLIRVPELEYREHICIIDTDICSGDTVKLACRILNTKEYVVPITLRPYQDLIDVEDLLFSNSILNTGQACSYLLNEEFFCKRTSLPPKLYPIVKKLVENGMGGRADFI